MLRLQGAKKDEILLSEQYLCAGHSGRVCVLLQSFQPMKSDNSFRNPGWFHRHGLEVWVWLRLIEY